MVVESDGENGSLYFISYDIVAFMFDRVPVFEILYLALDLVVDVW